MIRHRTAAILGGAVLGIGAVAGVGLRAEAADTIEQPPPSAVSDLDVQAAGEYWSCLVLDYVEAGTCLEDPLPTLDQVPSLRQLVYDLTGLGL